MPTPGGPAIHKIPNGFIADLAALKQKMASNDVIVYSDGSHTMNKTSYAAVAINPATGKEITYISGNLSEGKTIADAETSIMYCKTGGKNTSISII